MFKLFKEKELKKLSTDYEELFKGIGFKSEKEYWKDVAENLIDLDLAILGDKPQVYQEYVSNVQKEYAHATEKQWRDGRSEWICSMLDRKNIFYTDWGKKREEQARNNLFQELQHIKLANLALHKFSTGIY